MSLGQSVAKGAFRPPPGLRHPHVQSLLASWGWRKWLIRKGAARALSVSRPEVLECGAGVRLLGHYAPQPVGAMGLVILLHGWEGCADSQYILSSAMALYDAGFDIFRLNFRDHGGTQALNEGLFHSCRIDEVVDAVGVIQRSHASAPVFVVGYSLGGNFAVRTAVRAEQAGLALARVVAICPVLRPHSTMHALESGLWVYRQYFLNRWRRSLLAKAAIFPARYDFGDLRRFPTLTATTDFFVRRYTEFADLDSYLQGYAITGPALLGLSVPTHIISAADDPVVPSRDLQDLCPSNALAVTVMPRGGHCAFLQDYSLRSWLDRHVVRELQSAL